MSSSSNRSAFALRPNEHLAVLLPRHLWKPDRLATECDNFFCRVRFSLLERKHHCRKCGGVFCSKCTSQRTDLLDVTQLDFLHPPRNTPVRLFESEKSRVLNERVCDDCCELIHGTSNSAPTTPDLVHHRDVDDNRGSGESSRCPSPATPSSSPSLMFNLLHPALDRPPSVLSDSTSSASSSSLHTPTRRTSVRSAHLPLPHLLPSEEPSYGALDAYPLKRSSVLCKATGGGRWEPKRCTTIIGYRVPVPGVKAEYEVQMEKEERMERRRNEVKIIRNGDFHLCFPPRQSEVLQQLDSANTMCSRSFQLSTF